MPPLFSVDGDGDGFDATAPIATIPVGDTTIGPPLVTMIVAAKTGSLASVAAATAVVRSMEIAVIDMLVGRSAGDVRLRLIYSGAR